MREGAEAFRAAVQAALGHAPGVIEPGRLHRFPTRDSRADSAGWCKLFADGMGGVYGDWRCGITETWAAVDRSAMTLQQRVELARQVAAAVAERQRAQQAQWAENADRIAQLWAECVPLVPGDPVTMYLKRRGLGKAWPLPACLRMHRAMQYWVEGRGVGTFPAMVAPLCSHQGRVVALHRTYLTPDGRKAEVGNPKKLTATAGSLSGACIPLHKPARGSMGIAEGIETALAAWLASGVPTVAAYSASSLATWQWPSGLQRLAIFADNDRAGREAAGELFARARAAGLRTEVLTPSHEGVDWCDVWTQGELIAREEVLP